MNKTEHSNLKRLVGVWKTTGKVKSGDNTIDLNGTDVYRVILDGNFILHQADVMMGDKRSETFEIISTGNHRDSATMQYFNSEGEAGTMVGSIVNNEFNIEGKGLKFNGSINDDNTLITGKWSNQTENEKWEDFIDLRLEKQMIT